MYRGRTLIIEASSKRVGRSRQSSTEAPQPMWRDHLPPRCGSHRVQAACSGRGLRRVRCDVCARECCVLPLAAARIAGAHRS